MNKKFVLMIIEDIAIAVVLALIILYFVQPSIVRQTSMEETFHDGDYLLVSEDGANLLSRSTPIAFPVKGKVWINNHAHVLKFESMNLQRITARCRLID